MIVIGLDPGTNDSALVGYDGTRIYFREIWPNEKICEWMREDGPGAPVSRGAILVVEEFESYGMAVGREVFRTIRWAGNFEALWYPARVMFVPRRTVKTHICHTSRATDANIRTELIDRFGGPEKAIGLKKTPGPLFGIKSHLWAALALAVTFHDLYKDAPDEIRPGVQADF